MKFQLQWQSRVARVVWASVLCTIVANCDTGAPRITAILPGLASVTVSPATATLHAGDTLRASAQCPSCGPVAGQQFRWTSRDTTVAVVDSTGGLIRAVRTGTTTVFASFATDRFIQGSLSVTVVP